MRHKESDLQIRCIKWFRFQYPAFARLMEHPKNEGNGNRRQGAISKAEGVQAGVADIILHLPSFCDQVPDGYHSLAIEMKSPTGTQSREQKQWQRLFEAAGGQYVIIRSYDEFVDVVTRYMLNVPMSVKNAVLKAYAEIEREAEEEAREQFRKLLNKK